MFGLILQTKKLRDSHTNWWSPDVLGENLSFKGRAGLGHQWNYKPRLD